MSKTPLRSLKTIALALGLVITQGLVLTQQSSPVSANVGTNLQINGVSTFTAVAGTATTLTIAGSGFAPSSTIEITVNAPAGFNNTVGQHATAPANATPAFSPPGAANIQGDSIEAASAPTAGGALGPAVPNTFSVLAKADTGGNLVATVPTTCPPAAPPCPGAPAVITVPGNAPAGVYTVTGIDNSSAANAGSTTFTLTPNPSTAVTKMTARPVAPNVNNGVALGGVESVVINNLALPANTIVTFSLDDMLQTNTTGVVPAGFTAGAGAAGAIPLHVLTCGGSTSSQPGPTYSIAGLPAGSTLPTFPAGTATACTASAAGGLVAQVQLRNDVGANTIHTLTAGGALLFPDGVYTLVATSTQVQNVSGTGVVTYSAAPGAPITLFAGIQLDHTTTRISLSTSQTAPGGSINVRGFGFAANSQITIWFGAQQAPAAALDTTPVGPGCSFSLSGGGVTDSYEAGATLAAPPVDTDNCNLTAIPSTLTTDASGSFNASVTLPGSTIASTAAGVVLAEDFDGTTAGAAGGPPAGPTPPTVHLNASAISALGMNGSVTTTGTLSLTPSTAAVGSTVVFTGTGYTPFENVTVSITDSATGCVTTNVATVQAGAPTTSGGTANISGSFVVPTNACTAVATTSGTKNAGVTATVNATGQQSGLTTSNSLVIPATAAGLTLSPAPPAVPTTAVLTGTGFAANEPVSFSFGAADPFTGGASSLTVVVGQSDALGNVTVSAPLPSGASTGLFSVSATGLSSGFTVTGLQNIQSSGFLACTPTNCTSLLPGQQFVISGSSFSSTGLSSLFSPAGGTGTLSINFAPTPLPATQVTISSAGTFVFTGTVPLGTVPGTYSAQFSATVSTGATQVRSLPITVISGVAPTLVLTGGTSARIGDTIPISVTGFAPGEPITVEFDFPASSGVLSGTTVPGSKVTIGNADANGNLQGSYTLPTIATLVPGQYLLVARGANTARSASSTFTITGASTQVAAVTNIFFAEGFTGTTAGGANANFNENLAILNANNFTTTYTVTYFVLGNAAPTVITGTIGADSVISRTVSTDVGLNKQVAAEVSSPAPIAANRTIFRTDATGAMLDASSSLGQQIDLTATPPSTGFDYYLASGEVQLTNEEYLSILNPTSTAATVTINILPQTAISSTTVPTVAPISVSVPAMSRATVPIRAKLIGTGVTQFGLDVNSSVQIAVERDEYFGDGIGSAKYGTSTKPAASAGFRQYIFAADFGTAPSTGGTPGVGTGSDISEIDIINPGAVAAGSATVTVSFFDKSGAPINSQQVQVDGKTRETVAVNDVVGTQANVFSVIVTSDKNVFVEKPVFFGGDPSKGGKFATETPVGSAAGLTSVAFPDLSTLVSGTTNPYSETVYLYNPGASPITVRGIYVEGTATAVKTYTVASNAITAVNVNTDSAPLAAGLIGGIFQIVPSGTGNGESFVASLTGNTPDFKVVTGDQGSYPTSAATGF